MVLNSGDAGPCIDPATLNPFHVLWQAENAMPVGAESVGLGNQGCHAMRILRGKTYAHEYATCEFTEIGYFSTALNRRQPHVASLPSCYWIETIPFLPAPHCQTRQSR